MNQARDRTAGNTLLMRIASNLYIKMVAPVWPFSCNTGIKVTSAGIASPASVIRPLLWVRFFWENPKTDFWSQIIRILRYQKNPEDPKKDHLRLLYTSVSYRFSFLEKPPVKSFPKKPLRSWISETRIWIWSEESTLSVDSSDHIQVTPAGLAQECLLSGYPASERLKHARVCLRKCFDRRP